MTPAAQPHQDTEERLREMVEAVARQRVHSSSQDVSWDDPRDLAEGQRDWHRARASASLEAAGVPDLLAENADLRADNERLRGALEFYAEEANWQPTQTPEDVVEPVAWNDAGMRARGVLRDPAAELEAARLATGRMSDCPAALLNPTEDTPDG